MSTAKKAPQPVNGQTQPFVPAVIKTKGGNELPFLVRPVQGQPPNKVHGRLDPNGSDRTVNDVRAIHFRTEAEKNRAGYGAYGSQHGIHIKPEKFPQLVAH